MIQKLYKFHTQHKADLTLVVHPNNHPYDSDLIELDEDGYIEHIHQYPHPPEIWMQNLVNAALYVINKKTLIGDYSLSKINDFAKDLFPKLLDERKKLFGYISSEYIKDIGTPDRLNSLLLDIQSKKVDKLLSSVKQQTIFLDRDGVLSKTSLVNGKSFAPRNLRDFKLYSDSTQSVKKLKSKSFHTLNIPFF